MKNQYYLKWFFFFAIQTVIVFVYLRLTDTRDNIYSSQLPLQNTQNHPKAEYIRKWLILLWTWPFGQQFPLNQCPESSYGNSCIFTSNRSFYHLADAVIIHHRDVSISKNLLPQMPRPTMQYWVWFNMEAPNNCPNIEMMNNLINLTMTYRADSDIFAPYGWLERHQGTSFIIPTKSKLVAWVVSNWNHALERSKYFEQLKHHLDIDVYGKYNMMLSVANQSLVLSKYKFYLAFESSADTDYITEKLWKNAFLPGTVPIVMGAPRTNYERFIPQDSFIHVNDFSSAQELAAYVLELDKNDEKYHAYFRFRDFFQPCIASSWDTYYCKVCKTLKDAPPYRTIPNLDKWFRK